MQTLIGLAPLVAFFVAYKLSGIYVATAALMVVMVLVLAIDWLRERRIPPVHALSAVLVLIFGTATLVLHNSAFIQWKPTVLFWIFALAFLGSFWVGSQTLTERFLA
jgi:intracellular septation protein